MWDWRDLNGMGMFGGLWDGNDIVINFQERFKKSRTFPVGRIRLFNYLKQLLCNYCFIVVFINYLFSIIPVFHFSHFETAFSEHV